jgi:transcriptional regulator with XRE-family HTH domain
MARAALGLRVGELAEAAKIAPKTITRLEAGEHLSEGSVDAVQAALEALGAEFGKGSGVKLRGDAIGAETEVTGAGEIEALRNRIAELETQIAGGGGVHLTAEQIADRERVIASQIYPIPESSRKLPKFIGMNCYTWAGMQMIFARAFGMADAVARWRDEIDQMLGEELYSSKSDDWHFGGDYWFVKEAVRIQLMRREKDRELRGEALKAMGKA